MGFFPRTLPPLPRQHYWAAMGLSKMAIAFGTKITCMQRNEQAPHVGKGWVTVNWGEKTLSLLYRGMLVAHIAGFNSF